ncbi:MAG: MBOAT family protein [Clostridium sp.]|nr:MBOAT family protein [Clostridium sp.]
MVFSSIIFLFRFLPIFIICYFLAPKRMKNVILFLGSLIFYAWGEPVYVTLMLFSTIVDYALGRLIDANRGKPAAKVFLATSVAVNLLLLGVFKLHIGISFYTLQVMSYTIDVYRGEAKVQKNILDFGVFVSLFPQLIAGPIVRYKSVADSLHDRPVDINKISYGVKRFVTGLAKKVLIADNAGELWEIISVMDYGSMSVLSAWLGAVALAFRIYFNLSGYSDMAIGLGEILGFHFPENFNYPYLSSSVTEFGDRWFISLGSWFREYVYTPLGGSRKGLRRQMINILVVWALMGIWYGVGVNFLVWGLWFAVFVVLEKLFLGKALNGLPKLFRRVYTGLVVLFGWVIFSSETVTGALRYVKAMFNLNQGSVLDARGLYLGGEYLMLLVIAAVASTPVISGRIQKLKSSHTGYAMAIYRLGEKVVPPVLLLLSIAYIV